MKHPLIGMVIRKCIFNLYQEKHIGTKGNEKTERKKEMFYLTTHSTHFIYGYMASDIWLRTILIVRKETRCRHIGYSYRLTARVLLYASSPKRQSAAKSALDLPHAKVGVPYTDFKHKINNYILSTR